MLAVGVVILISIAIAAGVVFFIVLLGILWTLFARRDNKTDYAQYDDDDDSAHHQPSSLLEHINAATRSAIIGGTGSPFDDASKKKDGVSGDGGMVDNHEGDNFMRAETPSDAMHGMVLASQEQGRMARARYSFSGEAEGELQLSEGMSLEVLDDGDKEYV